MKATEAFKIAREAKDKQDEKHAEELCQEALKLIESSAKMGLFEIYNPWTKPVPRDDLIKLTFSKLEYLGYKCYLGDDGHGDEEITISWKKPKSS